MDAEFSSESKDHGIGNFITENNSASEVSGQVGKFPAVVEHGQHFRHWPITNQNRLSIEALSLVNKRRAKSGNIKVHSLRFPIRRVQDSNDVFPVLEAEEVDLVKDDNFHRGQNVGNILAQTHSECRSHNIVARLKIAHHFHSSL